MELYSRLSPALAMKHADLWHTVVVKMESECPQNVFKFIAACTSSHATKAFFWILVIYWHRTSRKKMRKNITWGTFKLWSPAVTVYTAFLNVKKLWFFSTRCLCVFLTVITACSNIPLNGNAGGSGQHSGRPDPSPTNALSLKSPTATARCFQNTNWTSGILDEVSKRALCGDHVHSSVRTSNRCLQPTNDWISGKIFMKFSMDIR